MRPSFLASSLPLAALAALAALASSAPAYAELEPGRLLLLLEGPPKTEADAAARVGALMAGGAPGRAAGSSVGGVRFVRSTLGGWLVAEVDLPVDPARAPAEAEAFTLRAIDGLRRDPAVRAAEPVTMKRALRVPNDELYPLLWGFEAIDLPLAWERTTGAAAQRIGVVDSGLARDHVDLIGRDVHGWDFISSPASAQDGDGRDADYTDEHLAGDFHGSHVAGTLGASANDGIGVAGVNWSAGIVTARVLGAGGRGSVLDIVEAAAWLAGFEVAHAPPIGADRVSVINLSLGGDEPCSAFERDVYQAILDEGVAIVAAAGNSGNRVPTGSPANCPGVIAVAAFGPSFSLASYSSFDDRIDVVAPGGEGVDDEDLVISVDGSGPAAWRGLEGTSMASPHVAGVVSLMQALKPSLSPQQIREILAASPFTCGGCANKAFLDAASALALAEETPGELGGAPPAPAAGGGGAAEEREGGLPCDGARGHWDCPQGEGCREGACVAGAHGDRSLGVPCARGGDCDSGLCDRGVCTRPCDGACEAGFACATKLVPGGLCRLETPPPRAACASGGAPALAPLALLLALLSSSRMAPRELRRRAARALSMAR
jgi:subtilisin family serine protease